MNILNIEIKAKLPDPEHARAFLKEQNALFKGVDHQIDHYFKAKEGRLKMRLGNIEQSLIHYNRSDQEGPKTSEVILYRSEELPVLKEILLKALDTLVIVDKHREIYFIDNVKFHIDEVKELGSFVEIEAIDETGEIGEERLLAQCQHYMKLLAIADEHLLSDSYSDMMLRLDKH